MESVAMMKSGSLAAQGFSLSLMSDFVAYIDRSAQTTRTHLTNLRQFGAWLLFTGIRNPIRRDILQYRDWLSTEHNAITLDTESPEGLAVQMQPRRGSHHADLQTVHHSRIPSKCQAILFMDGSSGLLSKRRRECTRPQSYSRTQKDVLHATGSAYR